MSELTLDLLAVEGALLRTLGLVERRGFPVQAVHAVRRDTRVEVRLTLLDTVRAPEVLVRQLHRLSEVLDVRLHTTSLSSPAADGYSVDPVEERSGPRWPQT